MTIDHDRLILVQKQLSIAVKALKAIANGDARWPVALNALDEIERIKLLKEGRYD